MSLGKAFKLSEWSPRHPLVVAQTQAPGAASPTTASQTNLHATQTILYKDQARVVLLNFERNSVSQEAAKII